MLLCEHAVGPKWVKQITVVAGWPTAPYSGSGRNDSRPPPWWPALDGKEECPRQEEQRRDTEKVAEAIEVEERLPSWLVRHEVHALAEEAIAVIAIDRLSEEGGLQEEQWRNSYKLWQHSCSKCRLH